MANEKEYDIRNLAKVCTEEGVPEFANELGGELCCSVGRNGHKPQCTHCGERETSKQSIIYVNSQFQK